MPASVTCIFLTRSGNGSLRIAVSAVPTSPPNSLTSTVVPAGCEPRGTMLWIRIATASPFSTPSTAMGPFRQAEFLAGDISLAFDASAKGVERFDFDNIAGFDGKHRLGIRAIYI